MSEKQLLVKKKYAKSYYDQLIREIDGNFLGLSPIHYNELCRYYRGLLKLLERRPFYQYNWLKRTLPMVKLINSLPVREKPWKILDAGCGVGTESIFWASLRDDVEVVGADIKQERLDVAQARLEKMKAATGKPLKVSFELTNIFKLLDTKQFDLIWTMEAISHIHPAEEFLSAAYNSLEPGGHLIISDSHLLNPKMQWRIIKLRRKSPKYTHKVLPDGSRIDYADERLFAVPFLKKLMRHAGFTGLQSQLSVFFPPGMARFEHLFSSLVGMDKALNYIPLLRLIGGIYTLSGKKTN